MGWSVGMGYACKKKEQTKQHHEIKCLYTKTNRDLMTKAIRLQIPNPGSASNRAEHNLYNVCCGDFSKPVRVQHCMLLWINGQAKSKRLQVK
jgi:hypothetical protein